MPTWTRWRSTSRSRSSYKRVAGSAVADDVAVDRDVAAVDLLELVDAAQQGALARPGRAEHDGDLAGGDGQVDAVEHLVLSVALADVVDDDHRMVDDADASPVSSRTASMIDVIAHPPASVVLRALSARARSATLRDAGTEALERCRRELARGAAGVVPLDVVLHDRQQRGEHEVPHRGDHQQRPHRAVAVVDHAHLVEQLADRHHVDDRRALEQVDDLVRAGRQDRAHRLGQHDSAELAEPWDPERGGRLALTEVDRQQPRAHHLGRVRRLVHGEPDDRRGHRAEQVERLARTRTPARTGSRSTASGTGRRGCTRTAG